jgi:uncharacterized membrane protein (DUF2068 family)
MTERPAEPGVRLIIAYKGARAVSALSASAAIVALKVTGHTAAIFSTAEALRQHATSAWSVKLAEALLRVVTPRHLWLAAGALALDGAFTALEGWALHRGAAWGEWLVVIATCTFVPFEVLALAHHPSVVRGLVLAFNVVIVVYLGQRAARKVRSSASRHPRASLDASVTRDAPSRPASS